jgi:hypothetical protein
MRPRTQYEIPAEMREAQQRFAEWRHSQSGRKPLPESLWALAATTARQHGVFRTAQALRLDYAKLKQLTPPTSSPKAKPRSVQKAAFVELLATSTPHSCECTIEVEGPRGRMRVEWKGSTAPDLAALSRVLWEPRAGFRSRPRFASWLRWSPLTRGKASTAWPSCAGRSAPPIRLRAACSSFAAAVGQRSSC